VLCVAPKASPVAGGENKGQSTGPVRGADYENQYFSHCRACDAEHGERKLLDNRDDIHMAHGLGMTLLPKFMPTFGIGLCRPELAR
jgi:hypothetical protein